MEQGTDIDVKTCITRHASIYVAGSVNGLYNIDA